MPLPKPHSGEEQDAFMARCMDNETMQREFPDHDQRVAVCMTEWRDRNKPKMIDRAHSILEIKSVREDERVIEGIATTPTPDRVGDIVDPLGAKFSLPMPLLWHHQHDNPVGVVEMAIPNKNGIPFRARIPRVNEPGELKNIVDRAWQSVKAGLVRGVSIGFKSIKKNPIADGGIHFKEWIWLELSLVTLPANAQATISAIKSIDRQTQAASGRSRSGSNSSPGVSGRTQPETKGTHTMKTIQEQISDLEERCNAHAKTMQALIDKEETDDLDASEKEQLADIEKDAKEDANRLRRLRILADTMATAKSVSGIEPIGASRSRGGNGNHPRIEVKTRLPEEKGLDFAAAAWCLMTAKGDPWRATEVAKSVYTLQGRPQVQEYLKAQVPGAITSYPAWLGNLATPELVEGEFVEFLRSSTILGKFGTNGIPSLRRVPFNIKVPIQTTGGEGYWTGEGRAKPLTSFDVTTATLPFYKVANIAVVSEEMLRFATISAETFIRDALRDALQSRLDSDFINPSITITAGIRPASITNGATNSASTAVTATEVREDLKTLITAFITAGISVSSLVWIMRETHALALATLTTTIGDREFPGISVTGGTLLEIPVITSQHVPLGIVVLVAANEIYLSDDGGVSIALSREASLEMDNAPSSLIADTASPPVSVEATMVSMFQTNSVAIRAERAIAWLRRRTAAVAYLTSVGWGNTASSPDGADI